MGDRIAACVRKAMAMGLSYGQYMARKEENTHEAPIVHLRACRGCGTTFSAKRSSQAYCSEECGLRARNRRKSARRRQRLAARLEPTSLRNGKGKGQ